MKSPDATARMAAAALIGELGAGPRAAWLGELADDPDAAVRADVDALLGRGLEQGDGLAAALVGGAGTAVRAALIRALDGPAARVRILRSTLAPAAADRSLPDAVRADAVTVMGSIGRPAIGPLCDALVYDRCAEVRQLAAFAIRQVAAEADLPAEAAAAIEDSLAFAVRTEDDSFVVDLIADSRKSLRDRRAKPVALPDETGYTARRKPPSGEHEKLDEGEGGSGRAGRLKGLIDGVAADGFDAARADARELLRLAKEEVAGRLAGPLNARLQELPADTYEQKKSIASWVNAELRELGLAVRCPKTGRPAILIADIRGTPDDASRFRLEVTEADGRKVRTWTGSDLSKLLPLEFREDEPRLEGPTVRRGRK